MPLNLSRCALAALFVATATTASAAQPHRRAVIVGINDYSASRIAGAKTSAGRDVVSLRAAVNDARAMRELLVLDYGFDARDIVILTDQAATRDAILGAIEQQLVEPAAKGDIVFFYYAGHGSHVRNSRSDEPDRMDETLVPADAGAGARDIRDKELRPLFNRILDRGARLTVMLDNCFSGSGARGLPATAQRRGVRPDLRDVADARKYGPRPEDRGALVLSAAQDDGTAYETNERGVLHGTFTWAWLHAVRDGAPGESATETFLRAQARMRAARPYQQPVLAGTGSARTTPFLGERLAAPRARLAVEKVRRDGTVVVQGGWANGLAIGSTLLLSTDPKITLTITTLLGLARSEAHLAPGVAAPAALQSGALLERNRWDAPSRPLRLAIARTTQSSGELARLALAMQRAAARGGVRWVRDPIDDHSPSHLLRRGTHGWELLHDGNRIAIGDDAAALTAIAKLPPHASLFVQFPLPDAFAIDGDDDDDPDYVLAGRSAGDRITYAWLRPAVTRNAERASPLPLRSAWTADAAKLRNALEHIRRIFAWQTLESPSGASADRLALRRERDGALVRTGKLAGGETYELLLRTGQGACPPRTERRFVYLFAIDRDGRATLLFPTNGSVENRVPPAPARLARIRVGPPYGLDTYFLLTTDDPLPDPWILAWDGVRGALPATWSLEKKTFESVPPHAESRSRAIRSDLSCLPNRRSENKWAAHRSIAATTTSATAPCAASRSSRTAASRPSSKAPATTPSR